VLIDQNIEGDKGLKEEKSWKIKFNNGKWRLLFLRLTAMMKTQTPFMQVSPPLYVSSQTAFF
jgi:hypothetical protein